jgi:hypothetical protein
VKRFSSLQLAAAAIVLCLLSLWLVRDTASAQQKAPAGAAKWEYKVVAFVSAGDLSDARNTAKTEEVESSKLNKLGEEGWEMTQIVQGGYPFLILKRSKR